MSFRKLYDAVMKERPSRGKSGIDWSTDEESGVITLLVGRPVDSKLSFDGTQMSTETGDFKKPELKIPETDNKRNYCSHNNFWRVQTTTNLAKSSKHEIKINLPNTDETAIENFLEEGREAAREHQTQDPAIKLVFQ